MFTYIFYFRSKIPNNNEKGNLTIRIAHSYIGCLYRQGPARKFKETAERLNQTYPIRLNETITIDSTHYNEKDNTVSYYYTVTGELDDPQFMDNNYATYKKALQEAIDNSVEMEEYRKFGSKIKYIYYSGSNKKKLAEFVF